MNSQRFIEGQRKGVNAIFGAFVALISFMWIATLLDWLFSLGWGWDEEILWLGPPMVLFATFVRFCAMAIFKFVEGN